MNKRRSRRLLCVLALLLFGSIVRPQSSPSLRPPNQAYIYDSTTTNAVAPVTPALNLSATYSIEFWMMLNPYVRDAQAGQVFNKGIPNNGDPFAAYSLSLIPGTHQLSYFQSTGSPGSVRGAQIGVSLKPGQWYHIAIVSDNLQVTLYLNGQRQMSFTAAGPPPINSVPLLLGPFPGSLRQFRIWGRALQTTEITAFATRLLSGSEAGLIADWPLDDGQGETLHDVGPNGLVLQLSNSYPILSILFPDWMRTEIVDNGPYFQVQRLAVSQTTVNSPSLTIPVDFDSDGKVDLLVCLGFATPVQSPCAAFRNDGKGNFSDVTLQVLGPDPPKFENAGDYCVADFNGDGRADVFIANDGECNTGCGSRGGQSALLIQTPDGRLGDATAAAGLPQQRMYTTNVACGDIDGDGDVDLYLQNIGSGPPQIYLNDGKGHFTLGESSRLPAIVQSSQAENVTARFINVNRDGRLDLFLGAAEFSYQPNDLLLLNDGHGFFTPAPANALPTRYGGRNWGTVSSSVVDFDGDGWPDLINTVNAQNYCEGAVQILLNNHDGTFRDATELILQPAWERHGSFYSDVPVYVDRVFAADFNGDGFMDLLVQGALQPSRLFLNTGPAGGNRLMEVTELLPDSANHFAVADFNGDGSADIAALTDECCNRDLTLETWLTTRRFALPPDLIPAIPTGPFFLRGSVLNSASFSADALAPGELVTIFGRNLGPGSLAVASPSTGAYPNELSGTRVLFNNVAAPIIYTSASALTAVVPFGVVPQTRADVVVEYQGAKSPPVSIYVAGSGPGMFTSDGSGAGPGAILNVDPASGAVSINSPQNPAPPGGIITVYITGAGQTVPPSTDGVVATSTGQLALPVEAGFNFQGASFGFSSSSCAANGCLPVQVLYAGPAPGLVAGVTQLNLLLPNSPSVRGTHDLGISIGGIWSQWFATVSTR
jgi:uncharacterized protein (TIGR03437 family)